MVSMREVERIIKKKKSNIQWTPEAKQTFCDNMETIMSIAIGKVESTRVELNGKKRIGAMNVNAAMYFLIKDLLVGEENE